MQRMIYLWNENDSKSQEKHKTKTKNKSGKKKIRRFLYEIIKGPFSMTKF